MLSLSSQIGKNEIRQTIRDNGFPSTRNKAVKGSDLKETADEVGNW